MQQLLLWNEETGKPTINDDYRHQSVIDNQKLINWSVQHLQGKFSLLKMIEYENACSVASVSLINAARAFKPEKGIKFSVYALRAIQNDLFREANKLLKKQDKECAVTENVLNELQCVDGELPEDIESKVIAVCKTYMNRKMRVVVIAKILRNFTIVEIAEVYNLKKSKAAKMYRDGMEILRRKFSTLT